jgi:N-acetylglucosaminyldiphosphoundecaprenol N-acetyl-beta-D-mannosaminyltransferase
MHETSPRRGGRVLGSFVDAVSWNEAIEQIACWADEHASRVVSICNVHVVVTASGAPLLKNAINESDMATPDGKPVALVLRFNGFPKQERIAGPDLMWRCCARAADSGQRIFLYGSTEDTLQRLQDRLRTAFPQLQIVGALSPPFRELSPEEDAWFVTEIAKSGAQIVFVGLGCPKQELWMSAHRGRIHAVMIGVGAAFDFHAEIIRRAPEWMQDWGLEWLHRLLSEPRRLWRRYLVTNALFVLKLIPELLAARLWRAK